MDHANAPETGGQARPNQRRQLKAGDCLIARGAPVRAAWRVLSGRIVARDAGAPDAPDAPDEAGDQDPPAHRSRSDSSAACGAPRALAAGHGPGELVALVPALLGGLSHRDWVAVADSEVVEQPRESLVTTLASDPSEALAALNRLSRRTRAWLELLDDEELRARWGGPRDGALDRLLSGLQRGLLRLRSSQESRISEQLSRSGGRRRLRAGDVLLREGAPADWAARIVSGRVLARKNVGGAMVELGTAGPGEIVGEMAVLDGQTRSAEVIAVEDTIADPIPAAMLEDLLVGAPEDAARSIRLLSSRLRRLVEFVDELRETEAPSPGLPRPGLLVELFDVGRDVLRHDLVRLRGVLKAEDRALRTLVGTWHRRTRGEASREEMKAANAALRELLKTLGIGGLAVLPMAFLTIPMLVKLGTRFGVEVLPRLELDETDLV